MNVLQERLASAVRLRESQNHEEARRLLLTLHAEFPDDPHGNDGSKLLCAWIHDLLGPEREAIPFYEKAIQTGVGGEGLKGSLLGLECNYRCVGDYQKSIETFQHALTLFPYSHEFKVFLAMERLLNSLANTSKEAGILRYQRAIHFYSDKLDQTW